MYLSQNIRHLAQVKGLKGNALAKKVGVTAQQMSNYMKGNSIPKTEAQLLLAEIFDVNLQDMIMLDLSKETARPFAGSDVEGAEESIIELNELLRQRVAVLERELKMKDPDLARELGIK